MASESTDRPSVALDLPAALDEWLTERAAEMGVDREELVLQLVSSYQVATESENGEAVEALEETLEDGAVDVDRAVEEAVTEAVPDDREVAEQVDKRIDGRLDTLEADLEDKLDDIRRRVVQVKQAADAKAPADHDHEEFDRLDDLEREADGLREQVAELEEVVDEGGRDGAVHEELSDVQSKLTQLARIVVDLRDGREEDDSESRALEHIKRTAGEEGFRAADCGACGESVDLALLTEAACPHCENPLRDVVPGSGGMLGSNPRLTGPNSAGATDDDSTGGDRPGTTEGGAADDD